MLDYKKKEDGLDYGEVLKPPPGYHLERAVGTTYSLDLVALLSIPVALFHHRNLDNGADEDHMSLVDAIQHMAERVTVYCQKGKISAQKEPGKALCFIEDCVREIMPTGPLISFHPKLWVLCFARENAPSLYRVVVGSRNLTFDRSWDVAYYLEGFVSAKVQAANAPLTDMLEWLAGQGSFPGKEAFIEQFRRVEFKVGEPFASMQFHPMGFRDRTSPLRTDQFKDLLVVSPFLDRSTLRELADRSSGKRWLLSRKEELDSIPLSDLEPFETWAFSGAVEEGEFIDGNDDEASEQRMYQQLHAKMYVGQDRNAGARWYLGSANCSQAAMERNTELLIRLDTDKPDLLPAAMAKSMLERADELQVFERYQRQQEAPTEREEYDFRKDTYALLEWLSSKDGLQATCRPSTAEGKYDVELVVDAHFPELPDLRISCAPYGYRGDEYSMEAGVVLTYEAMALFDLNPFLRWSLEKEGQEPVQFITRMEIDLPADRKDAVFRSFFKDAGAFLRFIQFLLGAQDEDLFSIGEEADGAVPKGMFGYGMLGAFPLLEQLLVAASRHPERLRSIDKAVKRLERIDGGEVIPEEFKNIWPQFRAFMHG